MVLYLTRLYQLTRLCPGAVAARKQEASSRTSGVRKWNGKKESPSYILVVAMAGNLKKTFSLCHALIFNIMRVIIPGLKCTNIRLGQGLTMCIWTRSLLAGSNRSRLRVQAKKQLSSDKYSRKQKKDNPLVLWHLKSKKTIELRQIIQKTEEDNALVLWALETNWSVKQFSSQLLLATKTPADRKEKMWSQIESEMCLQVLILVFSQSSWVSRF